MIINSKKWIALGVAATIAASSAVVTGTASAAPLAGNQLAVKEAVASDVVDVHYRRHRNGAAFAALALGVVGAVIAHQEYKRYRKRHHYYAPYAYGPYPYYAPRSYHYGYGYREAPQPRIHYPDRSWLYGGNG